MKPTPWLAAEPHRKQHPWGRASYGEDFGYFEIPGPCGMTLRVIVSAAMPEDDITWEHVSVSLKNRNPNWQEMHFIKQIFWGDDEAVMQLHPPQKNYVNCHPHCLHLWKPVHCDIPLPPSIMVGPDEFKEGPA